MSYTIPLYKIYRNKDDIKAVSNVLKRDTYWSVGPEIEVFEKHNSI